MVILSAVFRSAVSRLIDVMRDICAQRHFASHGTADVNTSTVYVWSVLEPHLIRSTVSDKWRCSDRIMALEPSLPVWRTEIEATEFEKNRFMPL